MAEEKTHSAFASSSYSSTVPSKKYDVFLSFRGEDTRMNFTSHLHEALEQKKVETYIDYRLEKGAEISPALIKAIEDSQVSVVILSKNYASSKWCLEELSKILECKKNQGQIVIPVFYDIDPSHVRKQTGSYEQAFAKHEGEPRCNKWKTALTEVANLAGWDSRNRTESEFLKDIVKDLLQKLTPRYTNTLKGMIGIEDNYEQIEPLLNLGSSDVRTLGIWGMGGIGKTTLATALYAKLSHKFEGACFLANVRENSEKHGLDTLRNKLLSGLLENKNDWFDPPFIVPDFAMGRLRLKKVFIVLDDVDTWEQYENLLEKYDFLGPGSRVLVTTRNKQILWIVDAVYEVKELSFHHSLQLFCLSVFREKQPKHGYEYLARRTISYCQGIPLALKVLGASLRSRSKEAWENELIKLQKIQNMEIHKVLKLSYDSLDQSQKDIFLDIACFFEGQKRDKVTSALEAFELFAESGIEVLLDKALMTISYDNTIEMHDLIQEMGWEIVHQESIKNPGKRSRLWRVEEVHDVLKYDRGTDVVEGLVLDLRQLTGDIYLSSNCFTKMTNMRFLKIHGCHWKNGFNVYLPNGLNSLSNKLRYLRWDGSHLESFPSNFCAEQLVRLCMPHSKVKRLWNGVQNLVNLKKIDLRCCRDLIEIPDLSKAEKLENVSLHCCESLRQLHSSMLSLPKLTYLDLRLCIEISSLNVQSKSMCELYLKGCSSLKEFSVTSQEMTHLDLSHTAICALSSSLLSVPKLTYLDLSGCREIKILDVHSQYLSVLHLNGCSSLKEFSVTSENITELDLSDTAVCALPSSTWSNRELTFLSLKGCNNLENLSDDCNLLQNASNLSCLPSLPHNITHLLSLEELDLSETNVESLPSNMKNLSLLTKLWLDNCRKLVSLPELPPSLRELSLDDCRKLVSLPELPPSLRKLWLVDCRNLVSLPELLPSSLTVVSAFNCTCLETNVIQWLVLHNMVQSLIPYIHYDERYDGGYIIPGNHVANKCGFLAAKSSITVPCLPLSDLCGFIYCVILSEGSNSGYVLCSVRQNGTLVGRGSIGISCTDIISDHALFSYVKTLDLFNDATLKFEFEYYDWIGHEHHQERIKECGVFPVYASDSGLKLFDGSSSTKEIGAEGSNNQNGNEWDQLLQVINLSVFF